MHIRATVFPIPPYTLLAGDGKNSFVGPIPTMIENLSQRLNFTYEFLVPSDNCSVSFKMANGSWTSFRGMIERNESDLALGPEVLMAEQMEGVKFGNYYTAGTFVFFASAGVSDIVDFSKLILAFDIEIWYILLAFILILAISVTIFDISDERFRGHIVKNKLKCFETNLWMFMASFFLEGTPRMPSLHKSRFVYGIWLMAVLTMMNAYSCQLKTALMVKGDGDTMYTIKDLSERPDLTVFIRKSGYLEKQFEESPAADYRKVWKNIVNKGKDGLITIEQLFSKMPYEAAKAGKGVVLNPQEVVKFLVQSFCLEMKGDRCLYFLKQPVLSNYFIFYTTLSFPDDFLRKLNTRVRWMFEAQLMERWIENSHKDYERRCLSQNENPDSLGLGLDHILPVIYILLIAQSLTVLMLFIEILFFHFLKSTRISQQNRIICR